MNTLAEIRNTDVQPSALLKMLSDVNEQALETFVALAADPRDAPHFSAFLSVLRRPLYGLDRAARQRIARIPHLLVDLRFRDAMWWSQLRDQPVRREGSHESAGGRATNRLIDVARSAVLLAWHAAQERRRNGALFLLGISPEVAGVIAGLRPLEVVHLAQLHYAQLQPRLSNHPELWMQLLAAGRSAEGKAFRSVQVRALQLLGADFLAGR